LGADSERRVDDLKNGTEFLYKKNLVREECRRRTPRVRKGKKTRNQLLYAAGKNDAPCMERVAGWLVT